MIPLLSIHSAPACGGKVVALATKGGMHFLARQGGCMVFAVARQHIKFPYEPARSVGRTHRSVRSTWTIEPGRREAPEPSSPSGLVHRACQPSGIQLPADSSHKPMISLTPKALEPPLHFFPYLWYIGSDIFNSLQGREKVHGWNWQSEPGWWKRVREFHGSASLS